MHLMIFQKQKLKSPFHFNMNTCIHCHTIKPRTAFYVHRKMKKGILNICIECHKALAKVNRRAKSIYYASYYKQRDQRPERRVAKVKYRKLRKLRHPERHAANRAVYRAINNGTLVRKPCQICGYTIVEAHHTNYIKRLDVVWLCKRHHDLIHNKENSNGNKSVNGQIRQRKNET